MSDRYRRRDLLKNKIIRRIIMNRNTQPVTQLLAFAPFIFVVVTGVIGISLGARNFSVVFTWILWSVLLTMVLVPLLGRGWCLVCPIVWPGELIQRKIWKKYGTSSLLNRKWPRILQNVWLQNFLFLIFAIWMVVLVTQPFVTAVAVVILITSATIIFIFFPRRRFCLHLCPPGLFIGIYSTYSPVEVRIKEKDVCLQPSSEGGCSKECYTGSENGYGCPWYEFPQNMVSNSDCGLCTECFKSCPKDNIALNIRPFNAELESGEPKRKADEAWRSLILLALPLVYTGVLFGPWAWIKNWGDLLLFTTSVGFLQHLFYAILVIDISLGVIPGLHLLASAISKRIGGVKDISVKKLFVEYAYCYIPLGLMLWVGFNFSLILMEWSYIPVVMSDPFGAGWNLLGATYIPWIPISFPIPIAEIIFALLGVFLSLRAGYSTLSRNFPEQKQATLAMIPFAALTVFISIVFLWFYI
jgi:ferredoxin